MDLTDIFSNWDKKAIAPLENAYAELYRQPDFLDEIITLCAKQKTQAGASWLLKYHFEHSNEQLDPTQTGKLFGLLDQLVEWEAQLHVLQCIPYLVIPGDQLTLVEQFVRNGIVSDRKFVRAWAYNGLNELARQHHQMQEDVEEILIEALEQEQAASVKARIRNIIKKTFA